MTCSNCKAYYQSIGRGGNYCPHCGTYNWGFDKNFFISLIIAALIFLSIYLYNSYYA